MNKHNCNGLCVIINTSGDNFSNLNLYINLHYLNLDIGYAYRYRCKVRDYVNLLWRCRQIH